MKSLFAAVCLCMGLMVSINAQDIVDLSSSQEELTTFVQAIEAADLTETFKGEGPITVFAPSNEAFAALPEGTLESLMLPENKDELVKILTYHMISGQMMSSEITDGKVATTQGEEVDIVVSENVVKVNEATVTSADIQASNGVIHIVNQVMMPPSRLKN